MPMTSFLQFTTFLLFMNNLLKHFQKDLCRNMVPGKIDIWLIQHMYSIATQHLSLRLPALLS